VPFAKAYSGLTDAEIAKVDAFIRQNTVEKFGPVRSVTPKLVCEIGFEGIAQSPRHKSGIAVRFPRILRLRDDKRIEEEWREHLRKQERWDRRIGIVAALLFILALTIVWAEKITGGML
jgi:ATP-dependent DNA ligase